MMKVKLISLLVFGIYNLSLGLATYDSLEPGTKIHAKYDRIVTNEELHTLIETSLLELQELRISNAQINDEAMVILSKGNWPNLKKLTMYNNQITDVGFITLMQGQWLSLEILELPGNQITDEGIRVFIDRNPWSKLTKLDFRDNRITYDGAAELLNTQQLSLLETLSLTTPQCPPANPPRTNLQTIAREKDINLFVVTANASKWP